MRVNNGRYARTANGNFYRGCNSGLVLHGTYVTWWRQRGNAREIKYHTHSRTEPKPKI
jgi:hypothetical protein